MNDDGRKVNGGMEESYRTRGRGNGHTCRYILCSMAYENEGIGNERM